MENLKLTKTNQSVEKALFILEILATNPAPMRLQDISAASNLPAATALRMVNTLVCCGYVRQDPQSQLYSLSFKVCRLAAYVKEQQTITRIARPFIEQLAQRCRESVTLAIEVDDAAQFIDFEERYVSGVAVLHQIGISVPYHVSAVGKLMLLNYTPQQIALKFAKSEKPNMTPRTIRSCEELIADMRTIQRKGYAMNDEESEQGARCMACPVFDFGGKICAAVGISGPSFRMTDDFIRTILPVLQDATNRISVELGYAGGKTVLDAWPEI